ncbi:MAG: hypothetical protein V1846_00370 [Candidatus Komeilibacteria bacterium]
MNTIYKLRIIKIIAWIMAIFSILPLMTIAMILVGKIPIIDPWSKWIEIHSQAWLFLYFLIGGIGIIKGNKLAVYFSFFFGAYILCEAFLLAVIALHTGFAPIYPWFRLVTNFVFGLGSVYIFYNKRLLDKTVN